MPDFELTGEAVVKLGPLEITLKAPKERAGEGLADSLIEGIKKATNSPADQLAALKARQVEIEKLLRTIQVEIEWIEHEQR